MNTELDYTNKLAEIRKELNTIKAENELLINDNKLIMDEINSSLANRIVK